MSYLHILLCIKTSKGFKSGNIWMHKLFSQNEGSDCLPFFFFWLRFSPLSRIFHSYGVTGEGLQNLTYTRSSWTLIIEGFERATPTVTRDIGLYFISPWHSQLLPSVEHWSCHYLFYDLYPSRLWFENPTFRMRGHRFNRLRYHDQITYRKTQFEKLKLIQIHAITPFFFPYLAFLRISSVLKTSVPKFLCTDVFLYW